MRNGKGAPKAFSETVNSPRGTVSSRGRPGRTEAVTGDQDKIPSLRSFTMYKITQATEVDVVSRTSPHWHSKDGNYPDPHTQRNRKISIG